MEKVIDPGRCKIVIAGAGGGKTTSLVNEVLQLLPGVKQEPHKNIAVITYTNAATEEVRTRLSRKVKIPSNIFIGTCHSFLIRFIVDPYAHLFDLTPCEKSYFDQITLHYKARNSFAKRNAEISLAQKVSKNGYIVFDKVFEIAQQLLSNDAVCRLVANRLHSILIDEYQDIRIHLHEIIKRILVERVTDFYCIGDPLQSIYDFTYTTSQIRSERPKSYTFQNLPLLTWQSSLPERTVILNRNYRCSPNIVALINNYSNKIGLTQTSERTNYTHPIFFLSGNEKDQLVLKFGDKSKKLGLDSDTSCKINKLILARFWKTLEDIAVKNSFRRLDNGLQRGTGLYSELKRCILGAVGRKQSDILQLIDPNDKKNSEIKFRQFCFTCYKYFRESNEDLDYKKEILKMFSDSFGKKLSVGENTNVLNSIKNLLPKKKLNNDRSNTFYSTIHTAKGLEATSVLVIAKNNAELQKWLSYDEVTNNNDDYRLGYVAFSRARQLLCFSCLEKLVDKSVLLLQKAGFTIE